MQHGISVEIVAILDTPCEVTFHLVADTLKDRDYVQLHKVNYRDLGLSRNTGIAIASGEIICVLDGDDLYSKNFLEGGLNHLYKCGDQTVVKPELVISFGNKYEVLQHLDQTSNDFFPETMFVRNYWCSWGIARKKLFLDFPYQPTGATGFGYEDWQWHCEVIANGITIRPAPTTAAFYRRKNNGLLSTTLQNSAIIRPSSLFSSKHIQPIVPSEKHIFFY